MDPTVQHIDHRFPPGRQVSFGDAVSLHLKNYVKFEGRSSRGAYWYAVLFYFLVVLGAVFIDLVISGGDDGSGPFETLVWLALLLPNITVTVRRLHDIGKSGWWWFLLQVPLIGWIFNLVWLTRPGQRIPNAYGPDVEAGRETRME